MQTHPSDLALERLLKEDPLPASVQDHLHTCSACWLRWEHLHADEGWPVPTRKPLPPAANRTSGAPWVVAGLSTLAAIAATAALVWMPTIQADAEVSRLRAEITALQLQLDGSGPATVPVSPSPPATQPASPDLERRAPSIPSGRDPARSTGSSAAPVVPAEVLDAAVDRAIEERTLDKMDRARAKYETEVAQRVADTLDAWVATGVVTPEIADRIEEIMHREFTETWELKAAVAAGHLSKDEGFEDYEVLRQEVDGALLEFLSEADLVDLRGRLERK